MEDEVDYGDPSKYVNDVQLELAWAAKAYERANVHMNLLISCDTKVLRLHKENEELYKAFRQAWPDLDVQKVTEVELKDGDNKVQWREFCEQFKAMDEYNMGTLMRMDASQAYTKDNSVIVPKIIYLAIEGARNVEEVNERNKEAYTKDHKQSEKEAGR